MYGVIFQENIFCHTYKIQVELLAEYDSESLNCVLLSNIGKLLG